MASLNKVILIGRLGRDPEITTFESGNKKMSATLATTERYRDRENNWVDQTEWHNLIAWGNLANGDMMYIEGRLRTRQFTDNQGINRYVTEVQVDKMMQLVPAKPLMQSSNPSSPYAPAQEPVYQAPATASDPLTDQQLQQDDLPF